MRPSDGADEAEPGSGRSATAAAAEPAPPRRSARRLVALVVVALGLAWLVVAGVRLAGAAEDARAGERLLQEARRSLDPTDLTEPGTAADLEAARARFAAAEEASGSALVAPLRYLPWAGRQLRAFHALSGAAAGVLETGTGALEQVQAALDRSGPDGASWAVTARTVADAVGAVAVDLEQVDLGPSEALVGPLADARDTMAAELADVRAAVERGRVITEGLSSFLDGPRRYLVLAANNAEMQAGWGMPLASGLLEVMDGELRLSGMRDIGEQLPPGAVPLEGDFATHWGMLVPNQEWRNLALTPRFDAAAPLAARMWEASGGEPVDGVLSVDPIALRAVLAASGPVEVSGVTVGPGEAVAFALHDQYALAEEAGETRTERRERMGDVAAAAIGRLTAGAGADPAALAEGLAEAAAGRHLLAWSRHAEEQAAWTAAGVDGTLEADSLLVALVNRGANKLDWFVDVAADLQVRPVEDALEAELRIRIENRTPEGEVDYVAGPVRQTGAREPGDYIGMVAVNLPGTADGGRFEGVDRLVAVGPDGPTRLVATTVELAAGSSTELVVRFRLPRSQASLEVEPSGRAEPIRWTAGSRSWNHGRSETVTLPTS